MVADPDTYLRLLGIAVEETPDIKAALRVADAANAEVRAREPAGEGR